MLLGRNELISTLFRETDRAQRMKNPLLLVHCGITNWDDWRLTLGESAVEPAISKIAELSMRLLRCYDSSGEITEGELLLVLPGCNSFNAAALAERLNTEVFTLPVELDQAQLRFTACFGVAASAGRSPYIVLWDCRWRFANRQESGCGQSVSLRRDRRA